MGGLKLNTSANYKTNELNFKPPNRMHITMVLRLLNFYLLHTQRVAKISSDLNQTIYYLYIKRT